jgi:hypothetical protein
MVVADTGLMGVAGASWGTATTEWGTEGTAVVRFPMLKMAGSTKAASGAAGG